MFVLELTYTAPVERVDTLLPAHVEWLGRHYEEGAFLASGRKVPRDGGIIIAAGDDRAAVEAIARTDPFAVAGVVEYRVTEFLATSVAPALEPHRQQLPA
ncbi:YciI family protein [Kitasatospora sp. NPDC057500]|uniref:YciI family protein n=1 Tax=Kitasatospora sp. NPDC057500 TaxID=3346151 RepID=UPI00368E505D